MLSKFSGSQTVQSLNRIQFDSIGLKCRIIVFLSGKAAGAASVKPLYRIQSNWLGFKCCIIFLIESSCIIAPVFFSIFHWFFFMSWPFLLPSLGFVRGCQKPKRLFFFRARLVWWIKRGARGVSAVEIECREIPHARWRVSCLSVLRQCKFNLRKSWR